ncbi:MAG: hypothetical protein NTW16_04510, partial [Bacteroidetes bacterium]|nr:hypothetical protein [Bacteroidota bacterium]
MIPRTSPNLITAPVTGLMIFDTTSNVMTYYNGVQWTFLCATSTGVAGTYGNQSSAGVSIKTGNSIPNQSAILDVSATDKGVLIPRLSNAQRELIQPAPGLVLYNTSTNSIEFYNGSAWYQLVTNSIPPPASGTHISSLTQIIWNWNAVEGATGYKWNSTNDYASATEMGTNLSKTEASLTCGNDYKRYVWAYNGCGNSAVAPLRQTTLSGFICGSSLTISHVASGGVAPVDKIVTYATVTNIPGEPSKCWITSNLGADHQATAVNDASEASAGWYWQFNRKQGYKHDGVTRTPNTAWISSISENFDWLAINDPCALELGCGWRIPTYTEWGDLDGSGNWTNWNGPWNSSLKLHAAGGLYYGTPLYRGSAGYYWSSNQTISDQSGIMFFDNANSGVRND